MNSETETPNSALPYIHCDYDEYRPESLRGFYVNEVRFDNFEDAEAYAATLADAYWKSSTVDHYFHDLKVAQIRSKRSEEEMRKRNEAKRLHLEEVARRNGFSNVAEYRRKKYASRAYYGPAVPAGEDHDITSPTAEYYGGKRPSDKDREAAA